MQQGDIQEVIEQAIKIAAEMNPQITDGTWLEDLTVQVGPYIKEWDIDRCYHWSEWPGREERFPNTTKQDVGIDAVAIRRSDGEHIAIQCKSRQLDADGSGETIPKTETDKIDSSSSGPFWAERWVVTNGNNPLSSSTLRSPSYEEKNIKLVNITEDLHQQQQVAITEEACPHCLPNPDGEFRIQTKSCMQSEAISASVKVLRQHVDSDSGGLPMGQARGKIILPCGTGKTRISLRIVEQLTQPGELSIVLCPSIALVAQIRREYLQYAERPFRALAVCSDVTAGYDPKGEGVRNTATDPTVDNSNVSASVVKGRVTTDSDEIAQWIRAGQNSGRISVIFGTYQSGRPIADALSFAAVTAQVLVADEAHRTAGLRRKKSAKNTLLSLEEQRVRDFTLCHDSEEMPATYRVYQTATPRIYDTTQVNRQRNSDWIVRSMDDEEVFGVELFRKSYVEAVKNGWLADYRIIAVGVNGPDVYEVANKLAQDTESKGRNRLTTPHFLRGLAFALAMGGTTESENSDTVPIRSCIAFMNTVDKSKNMAKDLDQKEVREWLQSWLSENHGGQRAAKYSLEHLDATSNVSVRESAKRRLAEATDANPHGVINVGIFGEGTDSPSLSAVAFLEPRKSPIDVVQAVGRAMRTAPGKSLGYIICPIVFPPNADAETWLSNSSPEEGWQELGQILLALRAHDQRIEENLAGLLQLYLPKDPEKVHTFIGIAKGENKRIQYWLHEGAPGGAKEDVENVLKGASPRTSRFAPIPNSEKIELQTLSAAASNNANLFDRIQEEQPTYEATAPTTIITGKLNDDGSLELRSDTVAREKPDSAGNPGAINIRRSKRRARDMINKGVGNPLLPQERKRKKRTKDDPEAMKLQLQLLGEMQEFGQAIRMNLLAKSGLTVDRVLRDINILEESVREAAHHLNADELRPALDRHFGLDNLKKSDLKKQADGCTIAALLMMNAAMLHQRIANGRWLSGVSDLEAVKNDVNVVRRVSREWNQILRHDFIPVLEPAVNAIEAIEDTGKLAGLERALRHIAAEAERIAETYADMGADHAGPLFNRVMGNQASDGAYFTRPVAASIAARLTLDVCGDVDWSDVQSWKEHKTVDLACGSGTLLAAMLTEMRRRARQQGANQTLLTQLQKLAVEETIKGLDINPVSLQLAASQLTAGNQEIRYRQMGLHLMPYGPQPDNSARVSAGTLELLGQKAIVARAGELDLADDNVASRSIWPQDADAELEDAVDAVMNARIVIMNPPFTRRAKMGEKFPASIKKDLQRRVDLMEEAMIQNDAAVADLVDKNAIRPLFTALADRCVQQESGIVTMVAPLAALCGTSGLQERKVLAQRFHVHTVLTCHQPGQTNMSQNTNINESIIVAQKQRGTKLPTRFIALDRLPVDEDETQDLHTCLLECSNGQIANGWGEVSSWPANRIAKGDWSAAIWRSPDLAVASARYASHEDLKSMGQSGVSPRRTSDEILRSCIRVESDVSDSLRVLETAGKDGQLFIESQPEGRWIPNDPEYGSLPIDRRAHQVSEKILHKAGHLLLPFRQDNSSARLTAVASDEKLVGTGWMPVQSLSPEASKATATFMNSTIGRIQLMRNTGMKLTYPTYPPAAYTNIRIPNIFEDRIRKVLASTWERTRAMKVPQFRDGECEVRVIWDNAVAEAMGWDAEELARLRKLLHNEPHVRGLGYNQYADEIEEDEDMRSYPDDGSN